MNVTRQVPRRQTTSPGRAAGTPVRGCRAAAERPQRVALRRVLASRPSACTYWLRCQERQRTALHSPFLHCPELANPGEAGRGGEGGRGAAWSEEAAASLTPGGSGVLADPAKIDEEFRKAWLPYFCRSGKRALRNSIVKLMVGYRFCLRFIRPG